MQIFVKALEGRRTFALDVSPSDTIYDLRNQLSSREALAEDARIAYGGKGLDEDSLTLSDIGIQRDSTLHLLPRLRGGAPKRRACTFKTCTNQAQRIVGDCTFCDGHFCGTHRLLEDHKCPGLEDCKKESHDRNASKLNAERTVVGKV